VTYVPRKKLLNFGGNADDVTLGCEWVTVGWGEVRWDMVGCGRVGLGWGVHDTVHGRMCVWFILVITVLQHQLPWWRYALY